MTPNPLPYILLSPTAFKGTLTPRKAARLMRRVINKNRPHWKVISLPLADGGDGTLEVFSNALKARRIQTKAVGPLGKSVTVQWAVVNSKNFPFGKTAIIEMARASGLALTKGRNKIMEATSFGTGQVIRAALDQGCQTIFIGVGGTATAEGGAGALRALGLKYFDKTGHELTEGINDLVKLARVDWSRFDSRIARTRIYVLCDVINPLLGPRGSARTFASQKGANRLQIRAIEKTLKHWSQFARIKTKNLPGSGAAGALAFGLSGFAGARLVKGAPFIMKVLRWKTLASRAKLILTGEGQIDRTSFSGKVIGEIVKNKKNAIVAAVCGKCQLSKMALRRRGVHSFVVMGHAGLKNPDHALKKATERLISNSLRVL